MVYSLINVDTLLQSFPMTDSETKEYRIKSFALRQGRRTTGQQTALDSFWHLYGIEYDANQLLNFETVFDNSNPTVLEIGFGNGDSLALMAIQNPELNYLGIEVHTPGVAQLLANIEENKITNIRIIRHDAIDVLEKMTPKKSLASLQLYFADPWPKRRHHKRRIVQRHFLELIAQYIKSDGTFHAATDWQDYAKHMMRVLTDSNDLFKNNAGVNNYIERPTARPITKFENRGTNKGHGVWDLIFTRL